MKLSASINSWEIIGKTNFLEKILEKIPVKKENHISYLSEWVRQNKIDGVELVVSVNITKKDVKQLKYFFQRHSIPVLSIHQPILKFHKIDIESIRFLAEAASELSAEVVVAHLASLQDLIFKKEFIFEIKSLEKNYNIKIGLENSSPNLLIAGPLSGSKKRRYWKNKDFSNIIKDKNFHITFDTTHMGQTGCDIVDFYSANYNRIVNIHLSDCKNNLLGVHLPLGKGKLPIAQLLKTARNHQYDALITLEINGKIKDLLESIEIVRRVFA